MSLKKRPNTLCFETVSGLKNNSGKSEITPIGEVVDVEDMSSIHGTSVSSLPIKSLGMALGASYKATSNWNDIIEKMEHLLAD